MSANEISLIVLCIGVFGWIPIWFFFNGIVKIIRAFKGLDDYGYDKKNCNFNTKNVAREE